MKKNKLPVLMYHRVLTPEERKAIPATPYEVLWSDFIAQLRFLKQEGFRTCTIDALMQPYALAARQDHAKTVALTFDDGYSDNYHRAFTSLQEFGFNATFFVIVNKIGTPDFMTWQQLREMQAAGMSIQSHTLNHAPLATLSLDYMHEEVHEARQILRRELRHDVEYISFPHGSYDENVLQAVLAAGYSAWCHSDFGYHTLEAATHGIPRLIVRDRHTLADFASLVYGRGPRYARFKLGAALRKTAAQTLGLDNYQRLYLKVYKKIRGRAMEEERFA